MHFYIFLYIISFFDNFVYEKYKKSERDFENCFTVSMSFMKTFSYPYNLKTKN